MRPAEFHLPIPEEGAEPYYLKVAIALALAIRKGVLAPGTALPGSRQLAKQLGANRKTIMAAFEELELEGWVESKATSGTFVPTRVPADWPRHWVRPGELPAVEPEFITQLTPLSQSSDPILDLRRGVPDPRLLPLEAISQAYHRALKRKAGSLLSGGEPYGESGYRRAIGAWLAERRGVMAGPKGVLAVRGAREGLELIARAFAGPEGWVAMEDPGDPVMRNAVLRAGSKIFPVPVDADGIRMDALEAGSNRVPIRLVYLTPHHQVPTGVTLAAARREHLLAWARRCRIPLVEDEGDCEFHAGERPPLPLAAQDPTGLILTLGSFSRWMAPAIRVGFIVTRPEIVEALARLKARQDPYGDRILERALGDLMRSGDFHKFLRRARQEYQARRRLVHERLATWRGFRVRLQGGLGFWVEQDSERDLTPWIEACDHRSIRIAPGASFFAGPVQSRGFYLGFSQMDPLEAGRALQAMEAELASAW